jgi:DNA polymerase/3'-5' exonuclease PolX
MANTNKKTIVEQFEEIKEILRANGLLTQEKEEFLDKRIEVTAKKNASSGGSKKLTPIQIANKGIASAIYEYLATNKVKMSISEMLKTIPVCAPLSNQKINGILTKLYDSEKHPNPNPMFVRYEEKGVAKFGANPDYVTAEVEGE